MLFLFGLIFAIVAALLVVLIAKPTLWLDYERRWTGVDRRRLIENRERYVRSVRLSALLGLVIVVGFVLAILFLDFELAEQTQFVRESLNLNQQGLVPEPSR